MSYRNAIRHTLYQDNTHHRTTDQRVTSTTNVVLADDDGFDNAEDDAESADDDEQCPDDIRLQTTVGVNHRSLTTVRLRVVWVIYRRLWLPWLHSDCSTHRHTTTVPATLPLFEGYAPFTVLAPVLSHAAISSYVSL